MNTLRCDKMDMRHDIEEAKRLGMSLYEYIQHCVGKELKEGGEHDKE